MGGKHITSKNLERRIVNTVGNHPAFRFVKVGKLTSNMSIRIGYDPDIVSSLMMADFLRKSEYLFRPRGYMFSYILKGQS